MVFRANLCTQAFGLLVDNFALATEQLVEGCPFAINIFNVKPVIRELVTLAGECGLALTEEIDLGLPDSSLPLALLNNGNERHGMRR